MKARLWWALNAQFRSRYTPICISVPGFFQEPLSSPNSFHLCAVKHPSNHKKRMPCCGMGGGRRDNSCHVIKKNSKSLNTVFFAHKRNSVNSSWCYYHHIVVRVTRFPWNCNQAWGTVESCEHNEQKWNEKHNFINSCLRPWWTRAGLHV